MISSQKPVVRLLAKDGDADRYEMRIPGNPLLRYRFIISNAERAVSRFPRILVERHFKNAYAALTEAQ